MQPRTSQSTEPSRRHGYKKLPAEAVEIMKTWLLANQENPYPSKRRFASLVKKTGLTRKQVRIWLTNARKVLSRLSTKLPQRILAPLGVFDQNSESSSEDDAQSTHPRGAPKNVHSLEFERSPENRPPQSLHEEVKLESPLVTAASPSASPSACLPEPQITGSCDCHQSPLLARTIQSAPDQQITNLAVLSYPTYLFIQQPLLNVQPCAFLRWNSQPGPSFY